jgi:hypothetical protein
MFVYAASNEAMPGLIKIGRATDVAERIWSLSKSTVVPVPFKLVASAATNNGIIAEALLHGTFAAFRVAPNREFFRVAEAAVICAFKLIDITATVPEIKVDDADAATNVVAMRATDATILDVLREAGRPLSNRELARLMNVCDGEATKRRRDFADRLKEVRDGKHVMVALA